MYFGEIRCKSIPSLLDVADTSKKLLSSEVGIDNKAFETMMRVYCSEMK